MKTGGVIQKKADPTKNMVWVATILPLRRYRDIYPFLLLSLRITKQMGRTAGGVRYGLKTNLRRKRFWTVSVWESRETMRAFVQADPHKKALLKFADWAGTGAAFSEWTGPDKTIDWKEVDAKLATPSFYYKKG